MALLACFRNVEISKVLLKSVVQGTSLFVSIVFCQRGFPEIPSEGPSTQLYCLDSWQISWLIFTASYYYHLRCVRAIRKSVSFSAFMTRIHALNCSRTDYCNSLHAGLPKVCLSSMQSVLNLAARLIARLPCCSHICTYHTWLISLTGFPLPLTFNIRYYYWYPKSS